MAACNRSFGGVKRLRVANGANGNLSDGFFAQSSKRPGTALRCQIGPLEIRFSRIHPQAPPKPVRKNPKLPWSPASKLHVPRIWARRSAARAPAPRERLQQVAWAARTAQGASARARMLHLRHAARRLGAARWFSLPEPPVPVPFSEAVQALSPLRQQSRRFSAGRQTLVMPALSPTMRPARSRPGTRPRATT